MNAQKEHQHTFHGRFLLRRHSCRPSACVPSFAACRAQDDPQNDINHVGWGVEIDGDGHLYVYNGDQENGIEGVSSATDTLLIQTGTPGENLASFLKTPQALGMGWHHVAIVRTLDGTVTYHEQELSNQIQKLHRCQPATGLQGHSMQEQEAEEEEPEGESEDQEEEEEMEQKKGVLKQ